MARDFNQNRIADAILGQATIDKYGKTFAVQFGLDGINVANVTVQPAPSSIIPYLEGDDTRTYAVPINVDELCDYALASFPNIEELTLFSLDIVSVEDHLSYLSKLKIMYVNQNNLSGYSWFPTTIHSGYESFTSVDDYIGYVVLYNALPYIVTENNKNNLDIVAGTTIAYDKYLTNITEDYTYEIKDYTQDHILTSQIITEQLNALTSQQRNAITKLVIASSYTSASVESVVWAYNFCTLLPYLNNNVWYNSVKYDFSTRELSGVDELLESDITNLINGISSDKINGVTQLKFSGFSNMNVALTYDYSDLPNLEYIWLDNLRYSTNEYQRVEYIESTGTQYVLTDIADYNKTKMKLGFELTNSSQGSYAKLCGNGTTTTGINCLAIYGDNRIGFYRKSSTVFYSSTFTVNQDYDLEIEFAPTNIKVVIDNVLKHSSVGSNYDYTGSYFQILGTNMKSKVDYFEIYEDITKTNTLVPAVRNSDSEIGLFDLVSCKFYENSGTGTFLKGNNVSLNILSSPTYFYPISDLVSEYDANENQTFYLDYNGTLPSNPNYKLTYYTDINCTTSILPENMQSGTRYYVKCNGTYGLSFANESWQNIKLALDNGVATYQLGDTKTITYNSQTYTIRLCDKGARYDITNGNGAKNKATFEFVEFVGTGKMNTTITNSGGFASSYMRSTVLPNIYNNLPSDLKSVISQVEISSADDGSASGSGSLSTSSNYLFLANIYELYGTREGSNVLEETTQYGLYLQNSSYRRKFDLQENGGDWWTRSPYAGDNGYFERVGTWAGAGISTANNELNVVPFFCI